MSLVRLARLGAEAAKNNFYRLEKPYKLTFAITYRCQSRCVTCGIWKMKPEGELDIKEIEEFARKNPYFRWIEITGGEPFLRADIVEIVRAFSRNCKGLYVLTMPTNSLCNKEMALSKIEEMLSMGIPKLSITVSLDGYKEMHDRIRGVPGNFDKAIEMFKGLEALKKKHRNLYFVFGYTLSKQNQNAFWRTFNEVKARIPNLRVNNFHINIAQVSESYYKNGESNIAADRMVAADVVMEVLKRRKAEAGAIPVMEDIFLNRLVDYLVDGKQPVKSKSLDASLFMDSFGDVYPSIMWGRKIGSIRESGYYLDKIWNSEAAGEVRRLIDEGKEPSSWTACEAYQSIAGDIYGSVIGRRRRVSNARI